MSRRQAENPVMTIPSRPLPFTAAKAVLAALALAGANAAVADLSPDAQAGQRLFSGQTPMSAQIVGHRSALPPPASRCVNCHATGTSASASGPREVAPSFGPVLSAKLLVEPAARRGGPPSRYDEAALCRLLRSGVDPAYIIIPRAMPRYELSDTDCRALWLYLNEVRN
jgi:hypothetical protein